MKDFEALSKKHFDKQADKYDETETMYYSKFPKISCRDVARKLESVDYGRLLDVGCGTGFLLGLLREQHLAEYHGLDLSPKMLEVAKSKLDEGVTFVEGGADELPYPDEYFDVVTCVQSFHHYPYPEKAMNEAYRVLKKGGLYILSDTGCSGIAKAFDNLVFRYLMNSGDYAAYSMSDIERFMTKSGFTVTACDKLSKFIFTVAGKKPLE